MAKRKKEKIKLVGFKVSKLEEMKLSKLEMFHNKKRSQLLREYLNADFDKHLHEEKGAVTIKLDF